MIDSILQKVLPSYPIQNELDRLRVVHSELMAEIEEIKVHSQTLKNNTKTKGEGASVLLSNIQDGLEHSIHLLEIGCKNIELAVGAGLRFKVRQNVHGNFQSSDLSNLKGEGDSPLYFSVQGVGELQEKEESLEFQSRYRQIVQKMQSFPEPSI